MKRILFVCTGNTCRSCMAEAITKDIISKKNIDNIFPSSAGIYAFSGDSASENAIRVMKERGIDLSCHRARRINPDILNEADVILAMTSSQKSAVISQFPPCSSRVFTVKEYAGEYGDINDPFGGNVETYRHCADELTYYIEKVLCKLRED